MTYFQSLCALKVEAREAAADSLLPYRSCPHFPLITRFQHTWDPSDYSINLDSVVAARNEDLHHRISCSSGKHWGEEGVRSNSVEAVTRIKPATAIAMPHSKKQHPATMNLRCSCWVLVVAADLGGNWAVELRRDYDDSMEGSLLGRLD